MDRGSACEARYTCKDAMHSNDATHKAHYATHNAHYTTYKAKTQKRSDTQAIHSDGENERAKQQTERESDRDEEFRVRQRLDALRRAVAGDVQQPLCLQRFGVLRDVRVQVLQKDNGGRMS